MSIAIRATPIRPRRASAPAGRALHMLVATEAAVAPLVARVSLGLLLFPHGAQHALGWFGGYGFAGTLGWMTGTLGFPAPAAALAIVVELLAPVALVLGIGAAWPRSASSA